MSGYKTFVLAGAGAVGKHIAHELLRLKKAGDISTVIILTRAGGTADYSDLIVLGAEVKRVDYSSTSSLVPVLTGVDVVLSTLGGDTVSRLDIQAPLIAAAKEADVKLFLPSEYGNDWTDWKGSKPSVFNQKEETRKLLQDIGLPYAWIATGPWSDYLFIPPAGFDFANGKVTIWGTGDNDISFTSQPDIARYVGYVLTKLPREKLENRAFYIEGDRISLNAIVREYEAKSGKKLQVEYRPVSELEDKLKANPDDLFAFLHLVWDARLGAHKAEEVANSEFPDWNPSKVVDVILA